MRFDLTRLLADDYDPASEKDAEVVTVPADPLLTSGAYDVLKLKLPR